MIGGFFVTHTSISGSFRDWTDCSDDIITAVRAYNGKLGFGGNL